jgi:hypothetical protein
MSGGPVVAVVGPCASGKSTLVAALRERDYTAHHVAQEHSYVPDMWQRMVHPDVLVYLHVSYQVARLRRRSLHQEEWLAVQSRRLRTATCISTPIPSLPGKSWSKCCRSSKMSDYDSLTARNARRIIAIA